MPLDNTEETGQNPDESGGAAEPAWAKALGESVGGLTLTMKELMTEARNRNGQQSAARTTPTPDDDEDNDNLPTPDELETMSRAQLSQFIMNQTLKAVQKQVVIPLTNQIHEISAATTRQDIQGAVKDLASSNKDFWDWKDEMIVLANAHKGLPPDKLYKLARAENPEKAAKLAEKYAPKAETKPKPRGYGGMTPSQSGTGSRGRAMKPKEAADVAWAETVAALGGAPDFDDE